jgi:hypothetical protein
VADSGLSFSLWKHLEDEGTEGILTTTLVGARAARFGRATVDRGGDRSFSMGQCLAHGEWELGRGWMQWRDGVLLGALYTAGAASRGGGGVELVMAGGV